MYIPEDENREQNDDMTEIGSEDEKKFEETLTESENTTSSDEINNDNGNEKDEPKYSVLLDIIGFIEMFSLALCTAFIVFFFAFRLCTVNGDSMNDTLYNRELLITTNLFYEPEQGDIIVFHQTSDKVDRFNEPLVKRVIATEGQKVYIDYAAGIVYVDDIPLEEDYIKLNGEYRLYAQYALPVVVPEGCVFVMGDNRNDSSDSRNSAIGFVDERRILGKVIVRVYPFDKFGSVD